MEYKDFFFQAAIYLFAAVLSVPLAKRLGFGSVLGYLIAGIIIGPFVLGMVGENSQDIMHFSEFGVVMMLFIIGLELKPSLLWKLRTQILGMGLAQVILTTLFLAGILIMLGYSLQVSVAIGLILSMSSTAIVMQIFNEKKLIKTPAGQSSFAILLFQDVAVIPIISLFPLLSDKNIQIVPTTIELMPHILAWQKVLLTLSVITLIILAGRFLLRPIFRFVAKANLREVFTAASLLLVIVNALAMQAIGLSPALGTFLAGVMLAESEYRHELEADVEPFKGLLLGLFFISVGAGINFNILIQYPFIIIKLIIILMTIKGFVLYFIARLFKYSKQDGTFGALTLSQGGEFCFVLISYAVTNRIFGYELANELILVVAISMLLTPVLIIFHDKLVIPRFIKAQSKRPYDKIIGHNSPVIIAGFGRYGQIIGRLLMANKINPTVLDLDSENIELIKKFGFKVFYGDAGRLDLLEAAGIKDAKILILAIDDSDKALEVAIQVKHKYPHLKILSRVSGRTQAYEFLKENLESIYRETFESSLSMGVEALEIMGFSREKALQSVQLFREYDQNSLKRLFKLYGKEKEYIMAAKQDRKNLEDAFEADELNRFIGQ